MLQASKATRQEPVSDEADKRLLIESRRAEEEKRNAVELKVSSTSSAAAGDGRRDHRRNSTYTGTRALLGAPLETSECLALATSRYLQAQQCPQHHVDTAGG